MKNADKAKLALGLLLFIAICMLIVLYAAS